MSQFLIQHYLNDLKTLQSASGTSRELVVREVFKTLLKDWGKSLDLIFLPEQGPTNCICVAKSPTNCICVAKSNVRFTPNSDRKSGHPHKVMSA